jgi:hypothetical protein
MKKLFFYTAGNPTLLWETAETPNSSKKLVNGVIIIESMILEKESLQYSEYIEVYKGETEDGPKVFLGTYFSTISIEGKLKLTRSSVYGHSPLIIIGTGYVSAPTKLTLSKPLFTEKYSNISFDKESTVAIKGTNQLLLGNYVITGVSGSEIECSLQSKVENLVKEVGIQEVEQHLTGYEMLGELKSTSLEVGSLIRNTKIQTHTADVQVYKRENFPTIIRVALNSVLAPLNFGGMVSRSDMFFLRFSSNTGLTEKHKHLCAALTGFPASSIAEWSLGTFTVFAVTPAYVYFKKEKSVRTLSDVSVSYKYKSTVSAEIIKGGINFNDSKDIVATPLYSLHGTIAGVILQQADINTHLLTHGRMLDYAQFEFEYKNNAVEGYYPCDVLYTSQTNGIVVLGYPEFWRSPSLISKFHKIWKMSNSAPPAHSQTSYTRNQGGDYATNYITYETKPLKRKDNYAYF